MAGVFIDPAESFSRALGQGLATFKSYRDEARQDEDRAFNKKMAERTFGLEEKKVGLLEKADTREGEKHQEWKDFAPYRKEDALSQNRFNKAQADTAEVGAKYADEKERAGIGLTKANTYQSYASGRAALTNAATSRGHLRLAQQEYNDKKERDGTLKFLNGFIGGISSGDYTAAIASPKATARLVTGMASLAYGSPVLAEALQNPLGGWRNDPKKVDALMPFVNLTGLTAGTAAARGYKRDARVLDIDATTVRTRDGKTVPGFKFTFEATNKKTGKRERFDAYQNASTFLDKANGYRAVFGAVKNDVPSQVRLMNAYSKANPEMFNEIMAHEVGIRQRRMKQLEKTAGGGQLATNAATAAEYARLQAELMKIDEGDASTISSIVFKRLGQIGGSL